MCLGGLYLLAEFRGVWDWYKTEFLVILLLFWEFSLAGCKFGVWLIVPALVSVC